MEVGELEEGRLLSMEKPGLGSGNVLSITKKRREKTA
jgi:hypothetical protein